MVCKVYKVMWVEAAFRHFSITVTHLMLLPHTHRCEIEGSVGQISK